MARRLTAVEGLAVGHATLADAWTGCTVVLGPPEGMRAAVHIRGRATGTRELDALSPRHIVPRINALLLTGGSAYGLGAADGVMRWLRERRRGFSVGVTIVPIVPAAVVFDLAPLGRSDRWPGPEEGYAACEAAGAAFEEGSVGAGAGATVGKALGVRHAMKGGVGTWAVRRDELVVGAVAVVNAWGDVRDGRGEIIAGARLEHGFADARSRLAAGADPLARFGDREAAAGNTTLVVVGTNSLADRYTLAETARNMADALARRITPVGTLVDGDVIFAVSVGTRALAPPMAIDLLAQDAAEMAIERAVRTARGTPEVPGLADGGR